MKIRCLSNKNQKFHNEVDFDIHLAKKGTVYARAVRYIPKENEKMTSTNRTHVFVLNKVEIK